MLRSHLASGVTSIVGNEQAFAALKSSNGQVVSWGSSYTGGDYANGVSTNYDSLDSGVMSIHAAGTQTFYATVCLTQLACARVALFAMCSCILPVVPPHCNESNCVT